MHIAILARGHVFAVTFKSRLRGIATPIATDSAYKEFEALLTQLIDRERPDRFNAALMDFGALQCRPQPDCTTCPFADECEARRTGRVDMLPVKAPKAKPKDRWFYYFDLRWRKEGVRYGRMHRRTGNDIWRGLWEFPLMEADHELNHEELHAAVTAFTEENFHLSPLTFHLSAPYLHQLTHRTIHARFIQAELPEEPVSHPADGMIMTDRQMNSVPVPRLIDKYLQTL